MRALPRLNWSESCHHQRPMALQKPHHFWLHRRRKRPEYEARPLARPGPPTDLPVAGEKFENVTLSVYSYVLPSRVFIYHVGTFYCPPPYYSNIFTIWFWILVELKILYPFQDHERLWTGLGDEEAADGSFLLWERWESQIRWEKLMHHLRYK